MANDIITSINWIDVLITIIALRILYIGIKLGIVIELFKLVSVFFAVFVTLHYFSSLSQFLHDKVSISDNVSMVIAYAFLWFTVIFVFKLIRDGITTVFKVEAHSLFDKWGGLVIAIGRGLLISSLAVFFLLTPRVEYFKKTIEHSVMGSRLVHVAPKFYESCYDGLVSKFFPHEELNKSVFTLHDFSTEKKQ